MISSLRGAVLHIASDSLVVEVGGVGFSVAVPPDVARTTHRGDTIALHTHLVVREDALSLFGFATREELELFTILIGVTGVGPKSALGILSALTVDQIAIAVANDDDAPFRKVSGIGPKTAKLISVQLAGKIAPPSPVAVVGGSVAPDVTTQVVAALTGLGWNERTAVDAVAQVAVSATEGERANVQALLRRTLAALGPGAARG
ncbi:Holliday junction branch migration protein RuvA [Microbacterium gorillae]|uniref:Holliday junction branch migration protein RuvA n=1 Tax=Microbacterium gorillae TaxID=1231063 RepID=UPI003D986972